MLTRTFKVTVGTALGLVVGLGSAVGGTISHGNPENGKKLATACIACHGPNGIGLTPLWPNLAGQKKDYLVKQIQAFIRGNRKDPVMSPMAKTLTNEEDVDAIAEYFSNLKLENK